MGLVKYVGYLGCCIEFGDGICLSLKGWWAIVEVSSRKIKFGVGKSC